MPTSLSLASADIRNLRSLQEAMLSPYAYASVDEWVCDYLARAKTLLKADKATLRFPLQTRFHQITEDLDESTLQNYRNYYWKQDFCGSFGGPQTNRHVWSRKRVYGTKLPLFYRSELYADLVKPARLFDSIGITTVPGCPPDATVLYLWHDRQSGPRFGDRGVQMLRTVLSAFQATAHVALEHASGSGCVGESIDALSDACALLNGEGRMLHANPPLRRLLDDTPTLRDAIERKGAVMAQRRRPGTRDESAIMVPEEHPAFSLHACYVGRDLPRSSAQMLLIAKPQPRMAGLAAAWSGLTAREREVGTLMAQRRTNREIARSLGISFHTARHHVERVKRKLGARRRHDLDP